MRTSLDQFIASRRALPFAYLQHDCAHIAADWVLAKTGSDPMADLRPGVMPGHGLRAVARVLRSEGGIRASATCRLGAPLPGLMAQRGDVVLVPAGRPGRFALGISTGSHIVAPGLTGMVFLPVTEGVAAWRV